MPLRLNSNISNYLLAYRDLKIAGGIKAVSIDRYISYIDDFYLINNINEPLFTREMIDLWFKPRNESEGNFVRYIRTCYLIEFLSYLTSLGFEVVMPRRPPYKKTNFIAHIFTDSELEKYFEYIDSFKSFKDPFVALYVPVIFRILIGCGTRIGETLALRVEDVDLQNGILYLKQTKNSSFRAVPVSEDLLKILRSYSNKCLYLKSKDDFFFSHIDKRKVKEQSIYLIHRKALAYAKIPYLGATKGPRLHDLRHSFAVRSLEQFERKGYDLNNVLPVLKQYMGHTDIAATEKYLQLVTFNYDTVLNKTRNTEILIMGDDKHEE